jgi:hypothetical protein
MRKSWNRLRNEVFRRCLVILSRLAFQACSFIRLRSRLNSARATARCPAEAAKPRRRTTTRTSLPRPQQLLRSARPTRASTVCPTRPTASARSCSIAVRMPRRRGAHLSRMQQEEAAAGRADRAFERRASPDARTHRGVGCRPRRAKTNHTPITDGSLPLTAIPRAARRTGRSLSRGARAAMPPSVPPPSAAA